VALVDDGVDDGLERRVRGHRDHVDARHHDLVDALVSELDDRVDHLLLLRLEDALLAAPLDEDPELLRAHDPLRGLARSEETGHALGDGRQHGHERAEDPQQQLHEAAEPQ